VKLWCVVNDLGYTKLTRAHAFTSIPPEETKYPPASPRSSTCEHFNAVHVVVLVSRYHDFMLSPTLITPHARIRPVHNITTTEIENTSSIWHQNGGQQRVLVSGLYSVKAPSTCGWNSLTISG